MFSLCHNPEHTIWRAHHSQCPSQIWWERAATSLANQTVTFVNVGANKGYNIAALAAQFGVNIRPWEWYLALLDYRRDVGHPFDPKAAGRARNGGGGALCGVCRACVERPKFISSSGIQLVGIELLPENARWLRYAITKFNLSAQVFNLAAGNETGNAVYVPKDSSIGSESVQVSSTHGTTMLPVGTIALDDLFQRQRIRHVHFVSIDAEGSDAQVLAGMRHHLRHGKIDAFEFEYSSFAWRKNSNATLLSTLEWLESLNYSCWWQGEDGCISLASSRCWSGALSEVAWSNLACVRRHTFAHSAVLKLASECVNGWGVLGRGSSDIFPQKQALSTFGPQYSRRWVLIMKHDREIANAAAASIRAHSRDRLPCWQHVKPET